jgi:hypothetical protein
LTLRCKGQPKIGQRRLMIGAFCLSPEIRLVPPALNQDGGEAGL